MANLPSLRQLNYLVTLADTLHFTKASEICFVSQSTFSTGIKELEETMGGLLFERNNKQVRLTQLGAEITVRATQLLADANAMIKISKQLTQPFSGDLHLGIIPTIAPFILTPLLAAIHLKHPNLNVHIHELQSHQAMTELNNGSLEMVLLATPYDTDDMRVSDVFAEPLKLVIHKDHPLLAKMDLANISFEQLPVDKLLLLEEGHCLREHTLSACIADEKPKNKSHTQHIGIEANSLLTLIQMIQSKVGFAMLPKMAIDAGLLSHTPELRVVDVKHAPTRTLALITRKTSTKLPEMKSFKTIIQGLKIA